MTAAAPITWAYVLSALAFAATLVAILLYAVWATRDDRVGFVERWLDSHIARHVAKALDNGDATTPLADVEMDVYRSRVAVPRQLTERSR